jgi:uncharacterized protein
MLDRDGYPPGVPCWVDTRRARPDAAAAFYGGLFGWEFGDVAPADAAGPYLVGRLEGRDVAAIGPGLDGADAAPSWRTYVRVESADDTAAAISQAGGTVLTEPVDMFDAARIATFADPSGAEFSVWQPYRLGGAQLVNSAGTWNWSDLSTGDREGAAAFYGSVFGWQAMTLDLGGDEATMWRAPGYGEFLAARDPTIRERHADDGIPPGFSDAIGWLTPMSSDQVADDVPPHWSITFAVDDTDATADTAARLGGTVVVAPYDAGPARLAVLDDPKGARFTVSRYSPA